MTEGVYPEAAQTLERILREKKRRRRFLGRLPIEEKVKIVIQLQRMLNDIRLKCGRTPLPEWKIPDR